MQTSVCRSEGSSGVVRRHPGPSQLSHGFKISTKNPFGNGGQTPPSDEEEEKPGDLGARPAASAKQPACGEGPGPAGQRWTGRIRSSSAGSSFLGGSGSWEALTHAERAGAVPWGVEAASWDLDGSFL